MKYMITIKELATVKKKGDFQSTSSIKDLKELREKLRLLVLNKSEYSYSIDISSTSHGDMFVFDADNVQLLKISYDLQNILKTVPQPDQVGLYIHEDRLI